MTRRRTKADILGIDPGQIDQLEHAPRKAKRDSARSAEEEAMATLASYAGKHGNFSGHTMNGLAFAEKHEGTVAFIEELRQWCVYNGIVWKAGKATLLMQAFAAERSDAAEEHHANEKSDPSEALAKITKAFLNSLDHQANALKAASDLPTMRRSLSQFDQQPHLFAVANMVLDLRKGQPAQARSTDYVRNQSPVVYDPDATCPEWLRFLKRVQPNREMRDYLQRMVGYILTGEVSEEKFFFRHGSGANGKSVFCGVLEAILDDYTAVLSFDNLAKRNNAKEADLVKGQLIGKRLASTNETQQRAVWNDSLIKELAARDQLSGRAMYEGAVRFTPTHKLLVKGNHVPGSHDTSDGLIRRYTPIGFNVTIPEEERDLDLERRVIRNELSGILNWALEGARQWYDDGLLEPECIEEERRQYKRDTDVFGQFVEERLRAKPGAECETQAVYQAYVRYMEKAGMHPSDERTFGRELKRVFGDALTKKSRPKRYVGLTLKSDFQ